MGTSGSKSSYESVPTEDHRRFTGNTWHLSSDELNHGYKSNTRSNGTQIELDIALHRVKEEARRAERAAELDRQEREKKEKRKEEAAAGRDAYGFNFDRIL